MAERATSADDLSAEHEARDWIVRLSSGTMTPAEGAQMQQWLDASPANRQAFERESSFWTGLDTLERDFATAAPAPARRGKTRRGRWTAAAAGGLVAASLLLLGVWFLTDARLRLTADHATGPGEQATVALPDGSTAYLNSDSAIDVRYRDALRLVVLKRGEALFEVRPDKQSTFRVAASGGNTDATGTVFATRLSDKDVTVTVVEGSVRVFGPAAPDAPHPPMGEGADVRADQQVSYVKDRRPSAVHSVNAADALAWRSGNIVLDGREFASALSEIGRYVPERLVLGDDVRNARPVSGVFSIRFPYRAMEALAATQGFSVYRIPHVAIFIR